MWFIVVVCLGFDLLIWFLIYLDYCFDCVGWLLCLYWFRNWGLSYGWLLFVALVVMCLRWVMVSFCVCWCLIDWFVSVMSVYFALFELLWFDCFVAVLFWLVLVLLVVSWALGFDCCDFFVDFCSRCWWCCDISLPVVFYLFC